MAAARPAGRRPAGISADVLIAAPWVLYSIGAPSRWPAWATVAVAAAGTAGLVAAWLAASRRRRATTERYLGAAGTGGLGPRGIRARQDAIGAEVGGRYGPEVARVAIRGTWRLLLGRALFHLFGVAAFASLAIDAEVGGSAATACIGVSIAVCVAGIVVTLMGAANTKAAAASARSQGGAPGIGMPREHYVRWCEQQGREPYPFGKPGGLAVTDAVQYAGADAGTTPGRGRPHWVAPLALAGPGVLILLAGCIAWGVSAYRPPRPAWQPGSINNLVLQAGPTVAANGNRYPQIATRARDPAPLSTGELASAFPPRTYGPSQLSADCAGAVTGQAVTRALRAAGCSQVLRLIATATGTGGPDTGLIDIFNLASGAAAYQAARAFGEQSPYKGAGLPLPPDSDPGGFILPWQGTAAAGVARAPGNAADVEAIGHFLAVLWTYGRSATLDNIGPDLANGLFEVGLDQFATNRVGRLDTAG